MHAVFVEDRCKDADQFYFPILQEFEKALHAGNIEHKAQTAGLKTNASLSEFLAEYLQKVSCKEFRFVV